ncbi:hypothetical protein [Microbispora rosea]|uniref:hypothetical protein n=1 Tax=Microbispora rosea TaxID=58117 RepID=UPI0033D0AD3F
MSDSTSRARGRPRDAGGDIAILQATLLVLTEVGYDQLTIDGSRPGPGAGKPTV